jgi:hypothetical protein
LIPPVGPVIFNSLSIQGAPPLAIGHRIAQYCAKQGVPSRQTGKNEEANQEGK